MSRWFCQLRRRAKCHGRHLPPGQMTFSIRSFQQRQTQGLTAICVSEGVHDVSLANVKSRKRRYTNHAKTADALGHFVIARRKYSLQSINSGSRHFWSNHAPRCDQDGGLRRRVVVSSETVRMIYEKRQASTSRLHNFLAFSWLFA